PSPGANGTVEGALKGNFDFTLTPDLKPGSVQGSAQLKVSRAVGAFSDLADLGADLKCEVTPTDIKQLALQFQKASNSLGELRVSGPFDVEKTEGRVKVELLSLDKRLLNLFGVTRGLDFGSTAVSSTNEIQLANAGSLITAVGRFNANQFQLTRSNQTTPTLDL